MIFEIGTKKWCHIPTEGTVFTRAASILHKFSVSGTPSQANEESVFIRRRSSSYGRTSKQGFRERWRCEEKPAAFEWRFFAVQKSEAKPCGFVRFQKFQPSTLAKRANFTSERSERLHKRPEGATSQARLLFFLWRCEEKPDGFWVKSFCDCRARQRAKAWREALRLRLFSKISTIHTREASKLHKWA